MGEAVAVIGSRAEHGQSRRSGWRHTGRGARSPGPPHTVPYGGCVGGEQTDASCRRAVGYGPEVWHTLAGVGWLYWDLWFCVVCVADHGGDWDALDTAIYQSDRHHREEKWSHLLDLVERLRQAGLTVADLVEAQHHPRGLRVKARTKVLQSSLSSRDLTAPMMDPPSARLRRRALCGLWSLFPHSPQPWYETLARRFDLDRRPNWDDGWATRTLAYEIAEVEEGLARQADGDPAELLAVRRAALTVYYEAAEDFDDSYGALGDVAGEAIGAYADADWRASGVALEVFWRDVLGWCVAASNYGLLHRREQDLLRRAGVGRDLDPVEMILTDLVSDYTAARMAWAVEEALTLRAYAVVAAGAINRFEPVATAIGARSWVALAALVDAAVERGRLDTALRLLDAAEAAADTTGFDTSTTNVAGRHRERIRGRRAELAGREIPT